MLKVVSMNGADKRSSQQQDAHKPKSFIYLVDGEHVTRSNTVFLFKLKEYQVEGFESIDVVWNRLEQVWDSDVAPFCLVLNHGDLNQEVRQFFAALDARSIFIPVLVVDREKFNFRRDDYCRGLSPDFPLFICRSDELVEFTSHLHILKNKMQKMQRLRSANQGMARQGLR